MIRNFFFT